MNARFLLDSNMLIAAMRGEPAKLLNKLATLPPERIGLSSVVLSELLVGAEKSQHRIKMLAHVADITHGMELLAFDSEDAAHYARIRAVLEKKGQPIGPHDTQIAAQALSRKLVLVTANLKEFSRVPGLKCENWL